jgi:predicted nucleotidyltransferase
VGMWLAQWWAAAEDATALSLEIFNKEEEAEAEATRTKKEIAAEVGNDDDGGVSTLITPAPQGDEVTVDIVMAPSIDNNAAADDVHHHHHHIVKKDAVAHAEKVGENKNVNAADVSIQKRQRISSYSRVIGVYARGSVARGEARAGVSDVDVVVVLWGHESADGVAKLAREKKQLREKLASADHWMGRWGHLATKADLRVVGLYKLNAVDP